MISIDKELYLLRSDFDLGLCPISNLEHYQHSIRISIDLSLVDRDENISIPINLSKYIN